MYTLTNYILFLCLLSVSATKLYKDTDSIFSVHSSILSTWNSVWHKISIQ